MAQGDMPIDRTDLPADIQAERAKTDRLDTLPGTTLDAAARQLLDGLNVGVLVQDPAAQILYCNRRARDLLGLDESEALGRTSLEADFVAFREDGTPLLGSEHPAPQAIATPRPVRGALMRWQRPGGGSLWLLVNADPEIGPDGRVDRVLVTLADVTGLRASAERLHESET